MQLGGTLVTLPTSEYWLSVVHPNRPAPHAPSRHPQYHLELVQIAFPPNKAQCIMHDQQEPDWISEALRQARYRSPLVSPESPDVIAGNVLVGFMVTSI